MTEESGDRNRGTSEHGEVLDEVAVDGVGS